MDAVYVGRVLLHADPDGKRVVFKHLFFIPNTILENNGTVKIVA